MDCGSLGQLGVCFICRFFKGNVNGRDLVLLKDSNATRNQWLRARVTKVFPDRFGVVRTIEVMTANRKHFVRDVRYVYVH